MSTTETPPPPTPVERRCPRCGAHLGEDQEWCLACGTAVGTEIAGPRGARATLVVVGVLVAIALIAVVLAIVELAGDAEQVTSVPQTPTPAATPAPTTEPEIPPAEEGGADPEPSATPGATVDAGDLAEWPQDRSAWTVILNSSGTEEDAQRLGGELAGKGIPNVGVLDSNDFQSLGPDSFIVFSGQYDSREAATQALSQIRDQAGGGSVRRIVPD